MIKGKPTVDEIIKQAELCQNEYYSTLLGKYTTDEQYYELDFKSLLKIPDQYKAEAIVLPTARDMVDTFVDHIDISNARVFTNKKGIHKIDDDEAEMMRKFYLGLIHRTNVESDISPWRVGAKHYALHGLAVFKTMWDADTWIDKPERKEGESEETYAERIDTWRSETHLSLPIAIKAVNPSNVFPDPNYSGRLYVIEMRSRSVFEVERFYPWWKNEKKRPVTDSVIHISYWDKDYRAEIIDGQAVLKVKTGVAKHNYGFIPYTFIESGLGNLAKDAKPEKRYVGILRYMFDLLVSESRSYSINDVVLSKTAFPWGVIEGDNAAAVGQIEQTFGTYTPLPPGVKLTDMLPQTPPQALRQHLGITSDYIAAHAAPRSLRGLSEEGVRSGADRRLVLAEAASRYQYSSEAFKNGAANVLIKCARLFKNVIPGDMRVWAKTPMDEFDVEVKKDKMKEPFTCYVEFAPISEEDEYRRHTDLEQLVAGGIVTRHWARTQMSNVDPKAMELDEERERLKNDPNLQALVSQYAATKLTEALNKRIGAEGIIPTAPVAPMGEAPLQPEAGGRLIPPVPNRAPIGSAQDINNQMSNIAVPRPKLAPRQGMGGGGNR